ncbi:MAG: hypothetical protein GF350_03040 [Chitinivibrionales bacterium]|nr:hypothetical protein [Chitinivibrionales bacterium]
MQQSSQGSIRGTPETFSDSTRISTNRKTVIQVSNLGFLSVVLYDDTGSTPLANTDYSIEGPDGERFSGTTDDEGYLFHPDVPLDDYDLSIDSITVKIPAVLESDERHLQRVIGYTLP